MVLKRQKEDEHDRDVTLAWTVELMRRQDRKKKLPPLETFLVKKAKQTPGAHKVAVQYLSELYGIPTRSRAKRKKKRRPKA